MHWILKPVVSFFLLSLTLWTNLYAMTPEVARQISPANISDSNGWTKFYETNEANFYTYNFGYGLSIYSKNTLMVRMLIELNNPQGVDYKRFVPGPQDSFQSATVNAEFSCDAKVVRLAKDVTKYAGKMGSQNEIGQSGGMLGVITPPSDYDAVNAQPDTWQSALLESMCKGRAKLIPIVDFNSRDSNSKGVWYIDPSTINTSKKGEVTIDVVLEGKHESYEMPTPDKKRSIRMSVTNYCQSRDVLINKSDFYSGHYGEGVLISTEPGDKKRVTTRTVFDDFICRAPGSGWGRFPQVR